MAVTPEEQHKRARRLRKTGRRFEQAAVDLRADRVRTESELFALATEYAEARIDHQEAIADFDALAHGG